MHTHTTREVLNRTALAFGLVLSTAALAQGVPPTEPPRDWMSQYQVRATRAAGELTLARLRCDVLAEAARLLCRKQALLPDIAARADAMADAIAQINATDTNALTGTRPAQSPPAPKR